METLKKNSPSASVIPATWTEALQRMERRETWTLRDDPTFRETLTNWAVYLARSSIHPTAKLSDAELTAAAYTPAGDAIVILARALTPEGLTHLIAGDIDNAMELAVRTVTQSRLQILDALEVLTNVFSQERINSFKAALDSGSWDINE
jgi:hypothetical protein